ncbi:MAG: prepilin-type N-terminal cleavage/methylation domain-containing protein [Rubripirellula sp.]
MPRFNSNRRAFSLIEILAAVMIAATVATIAVTQLRTPGDTAHARSCQLSRQTVQNETNRYVDITGSMPSSDLRQLTSAQHWDGPLPTCPVTGDAFTLDRSGNVNCTSHP